MTEPQFHAIIAVTFILHLIQAMASATIMRKLVKMEKMLKHKEEA